MSVIKRKVGMSFVLALIGATALADTSATLQVQNMYLFRGADLGEGDSLVAGSIDTEMSGFYAGAWAASGDASLGQEIDFYGGYAHSSADGSFGFDVGAMNYFYPSSDDYDTFGAYTEAYLKLNFDMFSFQVVKNVADKATGSTEATSLNGYFYYSAAATVNDFTFLVGFADTDQVDTNTDGDERDLDYTHVDVSYTLADVPGEWEDSLTFTLSKIVDQDVDRDDSFASGTEFREDDLLMHVGYEVTFDI